MRINVGCGQTPTPGYVNLDNSPAVRLARRPLRQRLMSMAGLLQPMQLEYIRFCQQNDIRYADGRRLPFSDGSVEVVYSSHTLEHLDREDAKAFLAEAKRVLRPGGILRIAVPDLRFYTQKYLKDGDVESFLFFTHLIGPPTRTARQKMYQTLVGKRHHQWMYDGPHLCRVFADVGFVDVRELPPGETTIPDPGALNLAERSPESLYVEGRKP